MNEGEQHECPLCHKTYSRRDLWLRHKRHCAPHRNTSKRKACNACVQARTKCCLSQPTCSRCAKRSLNCEYSNMASVTSNLPEDSADTTTDSRAAGPMRDGSIEPITGANSSSANDSDSNTLWGAQTNEASSGTMDFSMHGASFLGLDPISHFPTFSDQNIVQEMANEPAQDWPMPQWTDASSTAPSPLRDSNLNKVLFLLRQYPISFLSDDFRTPLLHQELYGTSISDITTLPKSTMAISSAAGLRSSNNASFLKRAISAERQRLVEGFHKYSCIEEWDALHAMCLYEMMELPDTGENKMEDWRIGPRVKGLNLPLLLKMTRRFRKSHPEATDPFATMPAPPLGQYTSLPSTWMTWLAGETAWRTMFLAHIINCVASRHPQTDELSPYYEPLDDELIWNMPLPCSSAAWTAQSEQEWLNALSVQDSPNHGENQQFPVADIPTPTVHGSTIKLLFTNYTKDSLKLRFGGEIGLQDSDSFRNLVVHCAMKHYL